MPQPSASEFSASLSARPLCVDLDGTLLRTDTTQERLILLLKGCGLSILRLPFWLMEGRPRVKAELAARTVLQPALLPVSTGFLEFLHGERAAGRRLVLVTGADSRTAGELAQHFGIFAEVFASDLKTNLISEQKRRRLVEAYGKKGFDYAGNSHADLRVWDSTSEAILVNTSPGVEAQARRRANVTRVFPRPAGLWTGLLQAMRPPYWLGNLWLFAPVIAGVGEAISPAIFRRALLGLLAFCCCASGAYMLRELFDLETARRDDRRRSGPFASGQTPLAVGLVASCLLIVISFGLCAWLPPAFGVYLAGYFVLALLHSFLRQESALWDVLVAVGLLNIRLLAGSAATGLPRATRWLWPGIILYAAFILLKRRFLSRNPRDPW